ncbi:MULTISPECIES: hypothetical protein [unclassified Ruminococcus]|uniref:hypothetical protein n=1 Tax=unclassified Ruminococcus TaxID=2608920 RepID=UPI0009302FDF|nr:MULTISPECIES: hypothetical protein [unclassified Ruminococcus]
MLVFAAIFTVVCFAATSGRNNIQIDNYPPEIQEEYFKTHDKPAPAESTRAAAVSTFCYYSTAADFETAAYADTACFVGAQVPPVASTVIPSLTVRMQPSSICMLASPLTVSEDTSTSFSTK